MKISKQNFKELEKEYILLYKEKRCSIHTFNYFMTYSNLDIRINKFIELLNYEGDTIYRFNRSEDIEVDFMNIIHHVYLDIWRLQNE